jgi:phage terminase large subunit-like protein
MADRFLREIRDMHQLRKDTRSLLPTRIEDFMKRLGDEAADDWVFRARDAPLPPSDLSWCWLFLGSHGAGKSHSMPVHMAVRAGISRIHLIAPTTADFYSRVETASWRPAVAIRCRRWVLSKRCSATPAGAVCASPAKSRRSCAARNATRAEGVRNLTL